MLYTVPGEVNIDADLLSHLQVAAFNNDHHTELTKPSQINQDIWHIFLPNTNYFYSHSLAASTLRLYQLAFCPLKTVQWSFLSLAEL